MTRRNLAAFGLFMDQIGAGEAADALKRTGFRCVDISVLVPDNSGTKDLGHQRHTKAPEGAFIGAAIGILFGAGLGWLLSSGNLAVPPWLAPFTMSGALTAVLCGMGAGSALGLVVGALIGSSTPEYEAIRYEGRSRRPGVLLSVHCDNMDWTKRAKDCLRQAGAKNISVRSEAKADFGATEKPLQRTRISTILDHPQLAKDVGLEVQEAADRPATEPTRSIVESRQT